MQKAFIDWMMDTAANNLQFVAEMIQIKIELVKVNLQLMIVDAKISLLA